MILSLYQELGIEEDLKAVQDVIRNQIKTSTAFIREALSDLLAHNGKLLRPALLILSSGFGDPDLQQADRQKIIELAASVEMLHIATLIHDDIIDQAPSRRGIPTLHTRYGARNAVLLGDFLFTRSFQLASRYTDLEMGRYIARAVNGICESEIRQHGHLSPSATSFKEYHRRIMGKTAALFALSAFIGAHESKADERQCLRLRKIGYNLGAGFQVIDDILDFSDRRDQTGKAAGSDIRQGIVNLPILFALREDKGKLERRLESRPSNGRALKQALSLTRELQGIRKARYCAEAYTRKALESVDLLPEGLAKEGLRSYVNFLLAREY